MEAARRRLHKGKRTAGVAVLAGAAEIIKSRLFSGKGRRHSGELDKQQLMIVYGLFRMRVRSSRWLASEAGEYGEGLGFVSHKVSYVYAPFMGKKKHRERSNAGQFFFFFLN